MNKLNFDGLKNVKAPEAWIEKAAAVPDMPANKRRAAFSAYRFAAAAVVVSVTVIGLMMFILFNRNIDPVMPIAPADTSANSSTQPADVQETMTAEPTHGGEVLPAEGERPTEPQAAVTPSPTVKPSGSEPAPTQPVQPTQNTPQPTEAVRPTAPPQTELPKPTAPPAPTQNPTERELTDCRFTVTVKYPPPEEDVPAASVETEDPIVFCRMYDASGNIVGSSSLYAEEKRADIVSIYPGDSLVVTYDPLEKGLPITRGHYTYVIYDYYTGTELCCGTVDY